MGVTGVTETVTRDIVVAGTAEMGDRSRWQGYATCSEDLDALLLQLPHHFGANHSRSDY